MGTNGPLTAPTGSVSSPTGPPPPPDQLEEQQSSLTELMHMWIKFGKTFAVILPIYVLGYFEFSFSWVLIGLAGLFYWRKNHGNQEYRINRALAFLEHEENAVKQSVPTTDLPPWVSLVLLIVSHRPRCSSSPVCSHLHHFLPQSSMSVGIIGMIVPPTG